MAVTVSFPVSDPPAPLGSGTIFILSLACGIAVANVYFMQAITPLIAAGLHVTPERAALAATATQLGYSVGIFFLVPLGDRVVHRRLLIVLLMFSGLGLLAAGMAPSLEWLLAASVLFGLVNVAPPIIIPMAAGLVPAQRRGAVTGKLLSGLIGGILLARSFGGSVGEWLGWRAPYLVAGVFAFVLALVLWRAVPVTRPVSRERYPVLLMASLRLLMTERELQRSCFYQAMAFAGFSAAWTSLTLLLAGPRYGMDAHVVGLIALVGAGSMFSTALAGRWSDKVGPDRVNTVCMLGLIVSAGVLAFGGGGSEGGGALGGMRGVAILTVGMLLLDVAVQSGQVANQARIFTLRPEVRGRLNTAYMMCAFLGAGAGSWLGVRGYARFGWAAGVCGLVAVTALLALAAHGTRAWAEKKPALAAPGPG